MQPSTGSGPFILYAAYDKVSGKIIHTHWRFSVSENRYVEIPVEELRAMFSNEMEIVEKLSNRDRSNLDFLKIELAHANETLGPVMVDPVQRTLVPRPKLALTADKREVMGDGKDSVKIDIAAVDSKGKTLPTASGAVKLTTQRGRLSDRGGIVNLVNGRATTTLTSVNETVQRVRVSAASLDGPFTPGYVDLEFV